MTDSRSQLVDVLLMSTAVRYYRNGHLSFRPGHGDGVDLDHEEALFVDCLLRGFSTRRTLKGVLQALRVESPARMVDHLFEYAANRAFSAPVRLVSVPSFRGAKQVILDVAGRIGEDRVAFGLGAAASRNSIIVQRTDRESTLVRSNQFANRLKEEGELLPHEFVQVVRALLRDSEAEEVVFASSTDLILFGDVVSTSQRTLFLEDEWPRGQIGPTEDSEDERIAVNRDSLEELFFCIANGSVDELFTISRCTGRFAERLESLALKTCETIYCSMVDQTSVLSRRKIEMNRLTLGSLRANERIGSVRQQESLPGIPVVTIAAEFRKRMELVFRIIGVLMGKDPKIKIQVWDGQAWALAILKGQKVELRLTDGSLHSESLHNSNHRVLLVPSHLRRVNPFFWEDPTQVFLLSECGLRTSRPHELCAREFTTFSVDELCDILPMIGPSHG